VAQFPQVFAGTSITASLLQAFAPLQVIKPADTSRTSTTSMTDDPDLTFQVAAGATYYVKGFISYEGFTRGSGDLKFTWDQPSGSTFKYVATYTNTSGTVVQNHESGSATVTAGSNAAGVSCPLEIEGTLVMSSTAGTFALQWAQGSSSTTPTKVHAQSVIQLTQCS
jgi:hypothetical protein